MAHEVFVLAADGAVKWLGRGIHGVKFKAMTEFNPPSVHAGQAFGNLTKGRSMDPSKDRGCEWGGFLPDQIAGLMAKSSN
jgi:hypothetical protein